MEWAMVFMICSAWTCDIEYAINYPTRKECMAAIPTMLRKQQKIVCAPISKD